MIEINNFHSITTIEKQIKISSRILNKMIVQRIVSTIINQIIIRNIVLIITIFLNNTIQFIKTTSNHSTKNVNNHHFAICHSQNRLFKSSTKTRSLREQIKRIRDTLIVCLIMSLVTILTIEKTNTIVLKIVSM